MGREVSQNENCWQYVLRDLQENKVPGKEQGAQPAALYLPVSFLAADPLG